MKKLVLIFTGGLFLLQAKSQTLKQAVANTENELFETSAQAFYKLIAAKPSDAELLYYMGENFYASERLDSALHYYTKGMMVDPNNALNYVGKGKVEMANGNLREAQGLFARARELSANKNPEVLLKIADAYVTNEAKDMAPAFEVLTIAEKLDAKNPKVYLTLGNAQLLATNDGTSALTNYEKAAALNESSPVPNVYMGALYERGRAYDLAFEQYNKAIAKDSTYAPAYRQLGDLYYKYNDYKKAKESYAKYLKLAGNSFSATVKYAKFLFLAKDYPAAIDEIQKIMAVDNSLNVLNRLLGYSYYETKQYSEGLLYLKKFFENAESGKNKIIAQDYSYMGKLLAATSADSLAVPEFKKAMEMDSANQDNYVDLSNAYLKMRKYDEAIATLSLKLQRMKDPGINEYFRLGQTLLRKAGALKDSTTYTEADSLFKIVTEKKPEEIMGYYFRAQANAGQDPQTVRGQAKPYYEKVIELGAADPVKNKRFLVEATYYLAYYYYNIKDKPNATTYADQVLAIDPTNQQATTLKTLIDKYLK